MRTPPYLQKGDLIALAAPARAISHSIAERAESTIRRYGFEALADPEVFLEHNQFAGTDEQRKDHFQRLLDHPDIKAILCLRGGYGSVRIIDELNFDQFNQHPKWIAGFSDITVFQLHVMAVHQSESLHCAMPVNFEEATNDTVQSLFDALQGKTPDFNIKPHPLNRRGETSGPVFGGNLSIVYNLLSSNSFPNPDGMILFLEDVDEYLYHVDRMMVALKRAGVLERISGLVVGGMTDMRDNNIGFGKNAEAIIAEHVSGFDYPLCFGFPAGHQKQNLSFLMGRTSTLEVNKEGSYFVQHHADSYGTTQ